jgi:uncharacterized membrane protein (UPF0127 family)
MRTLYRSLLSLSLVAVPSALQAKEPPQVLPLEAEWCLPSGQCIQLEVADEPQEQAMGLQLRGPLPPLQGMWFPFEDALLRFWMHRTPEPLDMVFINDNRVIAIEEAATPCPRLPCRSYGPNTPGDGVVELAAGEARRLGIVVGSEAVIRPLRPSALPPSARPAAPARD